MTGDKIEFIDGFICDWVFAVGECFRAALDLKTVTKTTNKEKTTVLQLGKNFSFSAGDIFWDHPSGHTADIWQKALPHINYGIQIHSAIAAGRSSGAEKYFPGQIVADIYKISESRDKTYRYAYLRCTQVELVNILQNGISEDELEIIAKII